MQTIEQFLIARAAPEASEKCKARQVALKSCAAIGLGSFVWAG
ncbi:hypothetical protein Z950_1184 [Sulfitobacter mediterraneus KCTC 32188]|nr:hypothetical protein Z950_1184 [Sulfitobacter mediterraneus KCTC 32188]